MIYFIIVILLGFTSCAIPEDIEDTISRASYGTKDNRIQFHVKGRYLKFSPNVDGFDDVSGATYEKVSIDNNVVQYKAIDSEDTLEVELADKDSVDILLNGNVEYKFTPRAVNLGRRPY